MPRSSSRDDTVIKDDISDGRDTLSVDDAEQNDMDENENEIDAGSELSVDAVSEEDVEEKPISNHQTRHKESNSRIFAPVSNVHHTSKVGEITRAMLDSLV